MQKVKEKSNWKGETIVEIEIEQLKAFRNHPFQVRDDDDLEKLKESIKMYGILTPLLVRPIKDGTYEIISGHRRKRAAALLGYRKIPVLIQPMSYEDAVVKMVDTNLHREHISFSEKAFAYRMKNEAMKQKVGRKKGQSGQQKKGKKTIELIGEEFGDSPKQIQRYIAVPEDKEEMRYFYEMYPDAVICPQVEDELITDANRPQVGDDLQIIFRIPWGHNKIILDKCKGNSAKALFYIRKTIENNWSRDVLLNFLGTDLYERQGKAITNFSNTLPIEQSDLAQAITKDPYNFDFLTLRERYDEKELKDALIEKVNNFLMELGTGFAYMGREVRIEVGDTEKFIDMLFYNTQRHCYVVVEIKTGKFDSSYAGQLGTYVVAVNHQMKTEADNPTLGLLICKDMDKVEAQYALESTSQPLGISSYELSKLIPEEFRGSMPTIEEIEAELNE